MGIDFHFAKAEQAWLRMINSYGHELCGAGHRYDYYEDNAYFRGLDALTLYSLVRSSKPQRIVEVGQGFSTRVILAALEENWKEENTHAKFVSIDPYARFAPDSHSVHFEVWAKPLQEVASGITDSLGSGDLLFVDSSHVFKFGSDVELFFDSVYPALKQGTFVHVHDIFSPFDYPKYWAVKQKRFWNEQYHLENFLRFNTQFEIVLPLHYLARQSPIVQNVARKLIRGGDHLFLGQSMYLQRVSSI